MSGFPFVPGDLVRAKLNGLDLRPEPVGDGVDTPHDHRWTTLKRDDLLTVVATGEPTGDGWRWYLMLHSSTGRYGWTTIRGDNPRNWEKVS